MKKILIIKGNWDIDEINILYLEKAGFQIYTATTILEGEKILREVSPTVVLIDIHLMDINSFEFVREICRNLDIIVSFVTMQHYNEQILNAIWVGGDNLIPKHFYPKELVTYLQSQIRTKGSYSDRPVIEIDNLRIDIDQKEVYKDGEIINLFTKEKKLLFYLVKNANKVISSQQIIDDIWGNDESTKEKTVVVHISTLRRKLGDSYSKGNWIQTVRGFGYKFVRD